MAAPPAELTPPEFLQLAGHPLRWQLLSDLARSDRTVHELTVLAGQPQNLVSYHLGKLRDARLVSARRSSADRRDAYYRALWDAGQRTVLAHGGSLSHHHGVGLNRARFVPEALGPAFDVLVAAKQALDPRGVLNPGKLGLPSPFLPDGWDWTTAVGAGR